MISCLGDSGENSMGKLTEYHISNFLADSQSSGPKLLYVLSDRKVTIWYAESSKPTV